MTGRRTDGPDETVSVSYYFGIKFIFTDNSDIGEDDDLQSWMLLDRGFEVDPKS